MSRKQGGQPGNTNALKHGFYSRKFRKLEMDDLEATFIDKLPDEIAATRVVIRRLFDTINDANPNLDSMINAVTAFSACTARLAGLMRTQKYLNGNGGTLDILHKALKEIVDELHISI